MGAALANGLHVTAINLGYWSPNSSCYLPAHSGGPVNVCLLGIAARRDCPFHPNPVARARLVSVALILTLYPTLARRAFSGQPLAATLPYAVRTFLQCGVSTRRLSVVLAACTSGSLAGFTPPLSRLPGRFAASASNDISRSIVEVVENDVANKVHLTHPRSRS